MMLQLLACTAAALSPPAAAAMGRRALLSGSAAAMGTAVSALHPLPAFADIMNRDNSINSDVSSSDIYG